MSVPRHAAVPAAILGTAAAVGLVVGGGVPAATVNVLLWAAFVVLVAIAMADRRARSATSPLVVVSVQVAVYGAVLPFVLIDSDQTFLLGADYRPWYTQASAACALAGCGFVAGWLAVRGQRHAPSSDAEMTDPSRAIDGSVPLGWWVLAAGAALLALRVAAYGFGTPGGEQSLQTSVTAYVLYAPQYLFSAGLYLLWRSREPLQRLASGLAMAVACYLFYSSYIRYTFVVAALAVALLVLFRTRGKVDVPLRWLVVGTIAVFVAVGTLGVNRNRQYYPYGGGPDLTEAAVGSLDIFNPLAAVLSDTGHTPLLLGRSYTYLVVQVIPRTVWPAKPLPPLLDALDDFSTREEGRAFPIWGEMYVNFGWPGIFVGMALFGAVVRRLHRAWLEHRATAPGLDVLAALAIPLLLQWISRGYFVQGVYSAFGFLVAPTLLLLADHHRARAARPALVP